MTQYYIDPNDLTRLTTKYLNGGTTEGLIPVTFVDHNKYRPIAGFVLIDYGRTNEPFSKSGTIPACEFIPPQIFRSHEPPWSFPRMVGAASKEVISLREHIDACERADPRYAISGKMREDHEALRKAEERFRPCVINIGT